METKTTPVEALLAEWEILVNSRSARKSYFAARQVSRRGAVKREPTTHELEAAARSAEQAARRYR